MKMKIKIFILLNVYLYTINNYSESSNDKSLYYFYQKLSKININKDTTLEKLLEEIKTATQQTAQEIDDVNLIKQKSEFIESLSKMLDDNQIKKISFGNIALFLERIGVEYQKNNELKNWKNNFFNINLNFDLIYIIHADFYQIRFFKSVQIPSEKIPIPTKY